MSMRKTKEVLRLKFELGLGQRQIARSCGMGLGTVHDYLERAAAAGLGWTLSRGWWRDGAGHGPRLFGTGGCGRHRLAVARRLERRGTGSQVVWKPTGSDP